jgi:hypothetical protein
MARATHAESKADWRRRIEAAYGGPLPAKTWSYLEKSRWIGDLEEGAASVEELIEHLRDINSGAPLAAALSARRVKGVEETTLFDEVDARLQAVAKVISWRADRNITVGSFRRRWLRNGMVATDGVTDWIDGVYRSHLPSGWPIDRGPAQATNHRGQFALWPHAHMQLEWVDVTAGTSKVWCVPPRGPLGELAKLAEKLANQWDWTLPYATCFILTGETPPRPGVRGISVRSRRGSDRDFGPYDLMWVRCSIDIEVTPEELAGWWRDARKHLGASGRKPIGKKATQLALFALTRDPGTTLQEDMEAWNAEVDEGWRYTDFRNYRTAAHNAIEALNRPALQCSL